MRSPKRPSLDVKLLPGDDEVKIVAETLIVCRHCMGCNFRFWQAYTPAFRDEYCVDCRSDERWARVAGRTHALSGSSAVGRAAGAGAGACKTNKAHAKKRHHGGARPRDKVATRHTKVSQ